MCTSSFNCKFELLWGPFNRLRDMKGELHRWASVMSPQGKCRVSTVEPKLHIREVTSLPLTGTRVARRLRLWDDRRNWGGGASGSLIYRHLWSEFIPVTQTILFCVPEPGVQSPPEYENWTRPLQLSDPTNRGYSHTFSYITTIHQNIAGMLLKA